MRTLLAAPVDTRPMTSLISFCTVQLRTLCAAHSLATLCLCTTSGPDPGEFPGFLGSMVSRHAPISRKGSGNQQQQQEKNVFFSFSINSRANKMIRQNKAMKLQQLYLLVYENHSYKANFLICDTHRALSAF